MISGMILGTISWLSLVLSWHHMPGRVKRWLLDHPVVADAIAVAITYTFLSSISHSIIAVVGMITAGLLVNLTIVTSKVFR